jgi:DNA-binding transcriptional LysR family regulator
LLGYADRILNLADETRAEITEAKEPRGSLTIRIPESIAIYRLAPVLKQFRCMYPKVRLTLTTCSHEGLQQDLRKGLTDLAFLLTDSIQAADIHVEVLGFEDIVMIAHPDHPLASKRVVRNKDLEGQAVLLSNVDCSYRRVFEALLDEKKVRVDKAIVFHSIAALKACLMEGYGLTLLPEVAVKEEILSKKLVRLKWEENKLETANLMIWYKERWLSPTLQAFMEITRGHFKGQTTA